MDSPSLDAPSDAASVAPALRWVVCLCAAWCGVCRDYAGIFEVLRAANPTLDFVWVDVEDEADWLGDLDIETFPTLVVADAKQVRFAGPMLPKAEALQRLLQSLQEGGSAVKDPIWQPLLMHLHSGKM